MVVIALADHDLNCILWRDASAAPHDGTVVLVGNVVYVHLNAPGAVWFSLRRPFHVGLCDWSGCALRCASGTGRSDQSALEPRIEIGTAVPHRTAQLCVERAFTRQSKPLKGGLSEAHVTRRLNGSQNIGIHLRLPPVCLATSLIIRLFPNVCASYLRH